MDEPAIELRDVEVRYGPVRAVDRASLSVGRGELVALLGGSGSGKTTLLKTINRLIEPSAGTIRVLGEDVRSFEAHLLRRRIGYCFQRVGLFPHLSVAQNVAITPRLCGWTPERVRARVEELLRMVALEGLAERMPRELSGGQEQRAGVARALAAEPEIVLFDEPFGALDPLLREELQAQLAALRERLGFTALFVTHDVLEAIALADRIAVLRDGKLLAAGTARDLAASDDPYVARLLDAPRRMLARARLS